MNGGKSKPPWVMFALLGCGAMITAFVCFIGLVMFIAMTVMRSSDPYQQSVQLAQRNPRVIAALGAPVEPSWLVRGEVQTANDSGRADLRVKLHGPKGNGTLYVKATRAKGVWIYDEQSVRAGDQTIDLADKISR